MLLALVALALASSTTTAEVRPSENLYAAPILAKLPDGRRLALYCSGHGSPTVIFDSGLGMPASVWKKVQPAVSEKTRTCSVDRAGYGRSDPGPAPRDARHIVDDLRAALAGERIKPPYILVAHSNGGWSARLFANLHPSEVAGMVLVEPSIDDEKLRAVSTAFVRAIADEEASAGKCIRATADGQMKPGGPLYVTCGSPPLDSPMASPSLARTVLSEQNNARLSSSEVSTRQVGFGAKPLIVLTGGAQFASASAYPAGATPSELSALQTVWREGHDDIARSSSIGVHRIVEGAAHVIQLSKPGEVVKAIDEVIDDTRR